MSGRLLAAMAVVWACCGVSRAGTIFTDPRMSVLDDDFSNPITGATVIVPDASGGGFFGYYNATGQVITDLVFQALIAPNLTQSVINLAFTCNTASDPFFKQCAYSYVGATGVLSIGFWGTNPADPTEPGEATDSEAGEQEGIPAVPDRCLLTPDDTSCLGVGHFAILLGDTLTAPGVSSSGGWSYSTNRALFNPGGPSFNVQQISNTFGAVPAFVPEPSTGLLLAPVLLVLGYLVRRRRVRPDSRRS